MNIHPMLALFYNVGMYGMFLTALISVKKYPNCDFKNSRYIDTKLRVDYVISSKSLF